jgi:hypothetical protein
MAWREDAVLGNVHVDKILDVDFSIAAEDSNAIITTITVKSAVTGKSMGRAVGLPFYISSDSAGQTLEAGTDLTPTADTNGLIIVDGGDSKVAGYIVTETTGLMGFKIADAGADTYYINLIMPDGRIETSGAITLAA